MVIVLAAYAEDLLGGEFGVSVFLAGACAFWVLAHPVPIACRRSRLTLHVISVYLMRSQKQVRSVYAQPVITRVAYESVSGINAVLDEIRNAVCAVFNFTFGELSVPARHASAWQPQPAVIRAARSHFRPKASNVLRGESGKLTILNRHDVTSDTGYFLLGPRECFEHPRGLLILPQVVY